jgi:signal transduction histidine kinase
MNSRVRIAKCYQKHNYQAEIDQNKMKQVFINIIENSMEAMPDGGTLTVDSVQDNGIIKISFTDTGRGMSKEQQKKIFQPFYTEKTGGSGIGLALAQKITRFHGGTVTFDTREKKGTTFFVFLPAA